MTTPVDEPVPAIVAALLHERACFPDSDAIATRTKAIARRSYAKKLESTPMGKRVKRLEQTVRDLLAALDTKEQQVTTKRRNPPPLGTDPSFGFDSI